MPLHLLGVREGVPLPLPEPVFEQRRDGGKSWLYGVVVQGVIQHTVSNDDVANGVDDVDDDVVKVSTHSIPQLRGQEGSPPSNRKSTHTPQLLVTNMPQYNVPSSSSKFAIQNFEIQSLVFQIQSSPAPAAVSLPAQQLPHPPQSPTGMRPGAATGAAPPRPRRPPACRPWMTHRRRPGRRSNRIDIP